MSHIVTYGLYEKGLSSNDRPFVLGNLISLLAAGD
jgi:hypothetical protein